MCRCQEQIAKLCSVEIKRAEDKDAQPSLPRGSKDSNDWIDKLVHDIGLCVTDKSDDLTIHCTTQVSTCRSDM